jgi:hypothetical protein
MNEREISSDISKKCPICDTVLMVIGSVQQYVIHHPLVSLRHQCSTSIPSHLRFQRVALGQNAIRLMVLMGGKEMEPLQKIGITDFNVRHFIYT